MIYNKFDKIFVTYIKVLQNNTIICNALEVSLYNLFDKFPVEASDGEIAKELYLYIKDSQIYNNVTIFNWWKV